VTPWRTRSIWLIVASFVLALPSLISFADTPAGQVTTQTVAPGQAYPDLAAHSTGWFDVGGFCKVVDVADLTWSTPRASGIPIFIPGPADQWENWRSSATNPASRYNGQVTVTTCCRPQAAIATLCARATNPTSVSRQYGKLGEIDLVAVTCQGTDGQYTESASFACAGDNGPDGQASWSQSGALSDVCAPNAQQLLGACTAPGNCGTGTQSVTALNSCGVVTSVTSQSCNTGISCCTPAADSCSGTCGGGTGVDSCGNMCANSTVCGPECTAFPITWEDDTFPGGDCSGTVPATEPGSDGTAIQTPTQANNWYGGSYSRSCSTASAWANDGSHKHTDGGLDAGYCQPVTCSGNVTWTVGGYTCTAAPETERYTPGLTVTVYTISEPPVSASTIGGVAQVTCEITGATGTWVLNSGATCGPGQCVPEPGFTTSYNDTCNSQCLIPTWDSCGNYLGQQSCSGGSCVAAPPPPPTSNSCTNATPFSTCSPYTYQCNDPNNTVFDDCGGLYNSCQIYLGAQCISNCPPVGGDWLTEQPACNNGASCPTPNSYRTLTESTPEEGSIIIGYQCN